MKKTIITLIAVILVAMLPMQALAATCQYATTQAFTDALDAQGIRYTWKGIDNDDDEQIDISYNGDYKSSIVTHWYFDKDPERIAVRVWNVITYDPDNFYYVLAAVNDANSAYRYCRTYVDTSDNTVTVAFDMPITLDSVPVSCVDMVETVVSIVDEVYNRIRQYDTAA